MLPVEAPTPVADRIVATPAQFSGAPFVEGSKLRADVLLTYLLSMRPDEIEVEFDLQEGDVAAVVAHAAELMRRQTESSPAVHPARPRCGRGRPHLGQPAHRRRAQGRGPPQGGVAGPGRGARSTRSLHPLTVMTADEIAAARVLHRCTFLPGSPPKRFARQMAAAAEHAPEKPLTERQAAYLWRLVWSYRRQLGDAWAEKAATMGGRPERPAREAAQRRPATTAQLTLPL